MGDMRAGQARLLVAVLLLLLGACGGGAGATQDAGDDNGGDAAEEPRSDAQDVDAAPPGDDVAAAGADSGPDSGEYGNDGGDEADGGAAGIDGGTDADGGQPVQPEDRRPCDRGACWEHAAALPRCGSFRIDEDFSTGKYNVHSYSSKLWAGAPTRMALDRTLGTWQPAVIVSEAAGGTILFDGSVGLTRAGLDVRAVLDGTTGARAEVEISSTADLSVTVHVTGWEVIQSGFVEFLPGSAEYTLSIDNDCGGPDINCVVNGHTVGESPCGWLRYTAQNVVPQLEGTRDQRLTNAARVAWWSIKEGVLYRPNPLSYSYCGASGSGYIDPLETCPDGRAWQVGLSGVQVPNFKDLAELEDTALRLFPGLTVDTVLFDAAREALLDDVDAAAVAASTGALRRSWLLRTSAVGFTVQEPIVTYECIDHSYSWCYGTGWDSTRWYAPDREHAMLAIDDVRAILAAAAP
ncbi:MAG: hypothetical protein HY897_09010 [Deltaproteobacteria bacterium]|nr:hypothetical protein [Deltaproteobacteria bacterium]